MLAMLLILVVLPAVIAAIDADVVVVADIAAKVAVLEKF